MTRMPPLGQSISIIVADDDPVVRDVVGRALRQHGYGVMTAENGDEAWEMASTAGQALFVIDWEMPGMDGLELIRRLRLRADRAVPYMLMLTSYNDVKDVVRGLTLGADDYLRKPFDMHELLARVQVGLRVMHLRSALVSRVSELEAALAHIHRLEQLLPICSNCRKIRDEQNQWRTIERYMADHAGVKFTHGICESCAQEWIADNATSAGGA